MFNTTKWIFWLSTSHLFPRQKKKWGKSIIYYGYLTLICAFYKNQNTSLRVCCGSFMKCLPTLAWCLNTWPPTSGTVWKDCGTFREWSLAGGSELLAGRGLKFDSQTQFLFTRCCLLTWYDGQSRIPATVFLLSRWILSPLWAHISPYHLSCFLCTLLQ